MLQMPCMIGWKTIILTAGVEEDIDEEEDDAEDGLVLDLRTHVSTKSYNPGRGALCRISAYVSTEQGVKKTKKAKKTKKGQQNRDRTLRVSVRASSSGLPPHMSQAAVAQLTETLQRFLETEGMRLASRRDAHKHHLKVSAEQKELLRRRETDKVLNPEKYRSNLGKSNTNTDGGGGSGRYSPSAEAQARRAPPKPRSSCG